MSKKLVRRDFLKGVLISSAGIIVTACAQATQTTAPQPTAPPQPQATAPQPTTPPQPTAPQPTTPPQPTAAPTTAGPKKGGTLIWAELGDFNSFNPWRMFSANAVIQNVVYSRLLYKDVNGKVFPDLAESWELAKDGLSLTVKLRQGAKWHDGKPFTAQDVADIFNYINDPNLIKDAGVAKIAGLLKSIKSVDAVDDITARLNFPSPIPFIEDILDYWYMVRIDDKTDAVLLAKPPVGTGPFKFVSWKAKDNARFDRYTDYHIKDLPYLDTLISTRLDQAETMVPNLQSGAVDGIVAVPSSDVETLKNDKNVWVLQGEGAGNIYNIIVNVKKAPLDKKEVRQALSYSLNRDSICKDLFYGLNQPTASPFYSSASIAYRKDLVTAHPFDLNKAKSLIDGAGVKNLTIKFLTSSAFPEWKLYAQLWQADLKTIGVTMDIVEVESAKFYEETGKADLGGYDLAGWGTGRAKRDPAIFFQTQPQYGGGPKTGVTNPYGWYNAEYEKIIGDARIELDVAKRTSLYQRANEILVDELPMLQICSNSTTTGISNKIQGVALDLLGYYMFDKATSSK